MNEQELIPHLFRTESGKIAAVLSRLFGMDQIGMVEDITNDTFLAALETWSYRGIPENPRAWLYTVAKNKARNYLSRNQLFNKKILTDIKSMGNEELELEIDWSDQHITDSQLQMLFAICHPSINIESQIGLALRILCGFGIGEIANAFLTNKETINKRLFRAKEILRSEEVRIELPSTFEINNRLQTVLTTLYLLFNEGYYSESHDAVLREDLCLEAMRLTHLLVENEQTNLPAVNALFALMCFHASRFPARKNSNGEIILYHEQDENLWNQELTNKGAVYLKQASAGESLTKYHLEAGIAYWHTIKTDSIEKWENILQLYNHLLSLEYSPVAALNRTYALSKVKGNRVAVAEAEKLNLHQNQYYHVLLGELYKDINKEKAMASFQRALDIARTQAEKLLVEQKIRSLR